MSGKDGSMVQLHQEAVFSAQSAYQTTGMGKVSVGVGQGTGRVDMWSGWPPVLVDSNSKLCGRGASWRGHSHYLLIFALTAYIPINHWFSYSETVSSSFKETKALNLLMLWKLFTHLWQRQWISRGTACPAPWPRTSSPPSPCWSPPLVLTM